jgi:hypothetical protein
MTKRTINATFLLDDARALDRLAVEASSVTGRRVTPAQVVSALALAQLRRINRLTATEDAAPLVTRRNPGALPDDQVGETYLAIIQVLTEDS